MSIRRGLESGRELILQGAGWRKGGWKPLRLRNDKSHGNAIRTVENVVQSIMDNIQIEELDAVIKSRTKHFIVCSIYSFAGQNRW